MTTVLTEGKHTADFLLSEANGSLSREIVTISSTAGGMEPGTVLGRIRGAVTTAAVGTNTGTGSIGTVTAGAGAMEGDYKVTIVEAATNAGDFVVENPLGAIVGHGTVAVAFSGGGISFTLADATDFVAGDTIKVTVAEGTEYAEYDKDNTDGTEFAVGVLYAAVPNSTADQSAVAIVRHAEVIEAELVGIDTPGKKQLAAAGIVCR